LSKILCLDFDGVLHSYTSGWKGARNIPDPPVPGAMAFLREAVARFEVAIHSSRARYFGGRRAMRRWLRFHLAEDWWKCEWVGSEDARLAYTAEDGNVIAGEVAIFVLSRISFPLWKPPAHVTLDDRALTFTGTWPALDTLADFKPWNK